MKAYLAIDFGSTYTKLTAIDLDNEVILATAKDITTVEDDIMIGFNKAFNKLKIEINKKINFDEISFVNKTACSSAAGGLKMVAIGLVPELTAEAAKKAALGAGARVIKTYAYELNSRELEEIKNTALDIILLAGGTDGGNKECIIHNAKMLAEFKVKIPVVVAGNKAAVIGGCANHSNLVTEYKYGIPSVGTMAHSYVQTFGVGSQAERTAFETFIKHRKNREKNSLILLIDTYNTIGMGIKNAIEAFKNCGIDDNYKGMYGVRIDSGDLAYLSKKCRKILDEAGFKKAKIVLTNSLNEELIRSLKEQGVCADSYGVGDEIAVSKSNPCFGGVYKIVEIDNEPVIKLSEDVVKISNPGFKEVYRVYDTCGLAYADLITLMKNDRDRELLINGKTLTIRDEKYDFKSSELKEGEYTVKRLTREYVINGEIIMSEYEKLFDIMDSQKYYLESLEKVSEERKRLENPHKYKVDLSSDLIELKYNLIKGIKAEIEK